MADTWGQNPFQPYTQQAADWERERQQQAADEQRQFLHRMAEIDRMNAQQTANMREMARSVTPARQPIHPLPVATVHSAGSVASPVQVSAGGGGGLALLGAAIGLFLAAGAGASVLGGVFIGGLIGALLVPVLKLVGWLTVTLLKVAFWVFVALFLLGVFGSLGG